MKNDLGHWYTRVNYRTIYHDHLKWTTNYFLLIYLRHDVTHMTVPSVLSFDRFMLTPFFFHNFPSTFTRDSKLPTHPEVSHLFRDTEKLPLLSYSIYSPDTFAYDVVPLPTFRLYQLLVPNPSLWHFSFRILTLFDRGRDLRVNKVNFGSLYLLNLGNVSKTRLNPKPFSKDWKTSSFEIRWIKRRDEKKRFYSYYYG